MNYTLREKLWQFFFKNGAITFIFKICMKLISYLSFKTKCLMIPSSDRMISRGLNVSRIFAKEKRYILIGQHHNFFQKIIVTFPLLQYNGLILNQPQRITSQDACCQEVLQQILQLSGFTTARSFECYMHTFHNLFLDDWQKANLFFKMLHHCMFQSKFKWEQGEV